SLEVKTHNALVNHWRQNSRYARVPRALPGLSSARASGTLALKSGHRSPRLHPRCFMVEFIDSYCNEIVYSDWHHKLPRCAEVPEISPNQGHRTITVGIDVRPAVVRGCIRSTLGGKFHARTHESNSFKRTTERTAKRIREPNSGCYSRAIRRSGT